jgi:hypothetical protein
MIDHRHGRVAHNIDGAVRGGGRPDGALCEHGGVNAALVQLDVGRFSVLERHFGSRGNFQHIFKKNS